MPVLNDIMDHEVIGPAIRQGFEEGFKQGFKEGLKKGLEIGLKQGRRQGEQEILRLLLEKRFGQLPTWVTVRAAKLSSSQANAIVLHLLDSPNLKDLFPE